MKFTAFSAIPEDDELNLPELVYWASVGELDEVKIRLAQGEDVNTMDAEGYSVLHAAAENGYLEIVKLLVQYGVHINHQGQYTALQLAEMAEQNHIVEYLKTL